jgi:hypothetical protein
MKARYLWLPVVIVSSFLAGTLVSTGRAQTSPRKPPKYIQVDYMKVQPGNEGDYMKVEQEGWKPIHQERIKQGKLHSWYFFGVDFPSGTETKYNYVTVNTFDQWGQVETRTPIWRPWCKKLIRERTSTSSLHTRAMRGSW